MQELLDLTLVCDDGKKVYIVQRDSPEQSFRCSDIFIAVAWMKLNFDKTILDRDRFSMWRTWISVIVGTKVSVVRASQKRSPYPAPNLTGWIDTAYYLSLFWMSMNMNILHISGSNHCILKSRVQSPVKTVKYSSKHTSAPCLESRTTEKMWTKAKCKKVRKQSAKKWENRGDWQHRGTTGRPPLSLPWTLSTKSTLHCRVCKVHFHQQQSLHNDTHYLIVGKKTSE